ncbi:hypothetical protein UFOVP63_30 [uncultured Caudovirales phage]|uniref:Internal virion protein B n=1 Tax=uncultured Caudovirales phage TaxID=2100421 RepID=A0A6J5KQW1_9CAUD|nr:hypothetical protein UFOVP63_30 [uncultured Caudovirales phage]
MCTIAAAIGAAGTVAQFAGQQQQADAQNAASEANAASARAAAANKYDASQRRDYFDQISAQKEGYDAAMKGRASIGTANASSGDSGVAGTTLGEIIASGQAQSAENQSRVDMKRADITQSYLDNVKGYQAEAQARINSMPKQDGPNPLGLAIGLASAGAQGAQNGWGWKMGFPTTVAPTIAAPTIGYNAG